MLNHTIRFSNLTKPFGIIGTSGKKTNKKYLISSVFVCERWLYMVRLEVDKCGRCRQFFLLVNHKFVSCQYFVFGSLCLYNVGCPNKFEETHAVECFFPFLYPMFLSLKLYSRYCMPNNKLSGGKTKGAFRWRSWRDLNFLKNRFHFRSDCLCFVQNAYVRLIASNLLGALVCILFPTNYDEREKIYFCSKS